jgi:hypothetical protein
LAATRRMASFGRARRTAEELVWKFSSQAIAIMQPNLISRHDVINGEFTSIDEYDLYNYIY